MREAYPDKGFQQGLPWLYYDKKRNGKDIIEEAARVKFRASFDIDKPEIGLLTTLKFVLAKYDIEGEFLGFEEMTDQLVICEKPMEEVQRIYRIGTSVKIECTYDLANLISENKFDRPRQQNIFYELFLVDWDGTPNGRLVDVPILMTNMVDSSFGTTAPNTENDEERWLLTRRFFLFDTISGIDQADYPNGIPEIVRYPAKINLMVSLSQGTDEKSMERINVPVLKIEYKERSRSYLEVKDKP